MIPVGCSSNAPVFANHKRDHLSGAHETPLLATSKAPSLARD
jgi:hypothetical protein